MSDSSVIIDDRNGVCISALPAKADAPLIIHANAVLPRAIALQLLQAIAGWHAKIVQAFRRVYDHELAQHRTLQLGGETSNPRSLEQSLGVSIGEALDHLK